MFKKLKEKITEEVKISPQRFAEFTQSVSDKLQNSTTSDENFFSIGEDDANTSTNSVDQGFTNVALVSPSQESRFRRNSNSSVASDVSFLPRYESGSMYHLQSDLDVSASEMEDNASTSSSQIGHLSKEQIYSAFQKSQMRYHKYRGRYTDLARHYKDLERENAKMKSVLVETQDKAIRRVTELKEQCNLEQKAKAHLESALRDEIDERNIKIQTLQTKVDLLQNGNNSDLLVDVSSKENNSQAETLENLTKYLNDARKEIEILNEKNQEYKANSIVFQSKEQEYKTKIANLEKEVAQFAEREKENNLKLAQNKMELHNEILNKDAELANLKKENEVLRSNLEAFETENKTTTNVKLENLQIQNKKLIDKVESLSLKSNNLESELLKVEKYKLEIRDLKQKEEELNKSLSDMKRINEEIAVEKENLSKLVNSLKEGLSSCEGTVKRLSAENLELKETLTKEKKNFENQISTIREEAKKGLLSLEPKIREKLQSEYLQKQEELKQEFAIKIDEVSSSNHSLKEVQLQLFEKEDNIKKLTVELDILRTEFSKAVEDYRNLEKNHLELIEDSTKLRNTISNLEKEKSLFESYEEKISRLEAHISTLQEEVKVLQDLSERKEIENVYLSKENIDLQQAMTKETEIRRILEERHEAVNLEGSESKLLELKLQKLEEEKQNLLEEFEQERKMFNDMLRDNKELKEKQYVIVELKEALNKRHHEISNLNERLEQERQKNIHLSDEKYNLESEVTKLQEQVRIHEEKDEAIDLDKSESGILKLKLQKLEEENKKLLESFELERLTLANELEDIKQDLSKEEQTYLREISEDEPSAALTIEKLRENLHDIRRLSTAKEKENVYLSQENFNLQQERNNLSQKLRLLEEKLETSQLDSTESKLLELKVQKLEHENQKLLDDFEMERKMFNELLENNKEVKVKENLIVELKDCLSKCHKEIVDLKENLGAQKKDNVWLENKKLELEKHIRILTEKVRIHEEKNEAINMDSNECHLLEMKLQKLEEENLSLLESFELERKTFNKMYEEHAKTEVKLTELIEENLQIKNQIKTGKEEIEKLSTLLKNKTVEQKAAEEENQQSLKKIQELSNKTKIEEEELKKLQTILKEHDALKMENDSNMKNLQRLTSDNEKLKKDLDVKDKEVSELSRNIRKLSSVIEKQTTEFNSLLKRTQQLESVLEKMQTDSAESIKKEKERQNELTAKIEDLQKELNDKSSEFTDLSQKLVELEKLYNVEKNNYQEKSQEIKSLQKKVRELQAVEESFKMIGEEKRVVDNELVRLKLVESNFKAIENEKVSLEKKLKQAEGEFKAKNNDITQKYKIIEQECNLLKDEKEKLLTEINNLRSKIEELNLENNNLKAVSVKVAEASNNSEQLKKLSTALESERDQLSKEISELNIRINQISADNRVIVEENQNLMHDNEELKIKIEFLEKEQSEFNEIKNKLLEEKEFLASSADEFKQQLDDVQKQNLELVNDRFLTTSNEADITKIQQDFHEIKGKCDNLFVENKNLKQEYAKLEDKCNDFDKVKRKLETQITELEHQYTEIVHEKQLLQDEVQELKISPVNVKNSPTSKLDELEILKQAKAFTVDASSSSDKSTQNDKELYAKEIEILRDKLTQYKSLDITNKSSIEFYENELQKMKNHNEKLNRKLDETLVTLNHCAELSSSTEVEYLKNVLYNYMLGKESLVLARVIAAVCKFDPQQTETVLQREQQKQTLLGQLGLI